MKVFAKREVLEYNLKWDNFMISKTWFFGKDSDIICFRYLLLKTMPACAA